MIGCVLNKKFQSFFLLNLGRNTAHWEHRRSWPPIGPISTPKCCKLRALSPHAISCQLGAMEIDPLDVPFFHNLAYFFPIFSLFFPYFFPIFSQRFPKDFPKITQNFQVFYLTNILTNSCSKHDNKLNTHACDQIVFKHAILFHKIW